jgi:hypothetical protein
MQKLLFQSLSGFLEDLEWGDRKVKWDYPTFRPQQNLLMIISQIA